MKVTDLMNLSLLCMNHWKSIDPRGMARVTLSKSGTNRITNVNVELATIRSTVSVLLMSDEAPSSTWDHGGECEWSMEVADERFGVSGQQRRSVNSVGLPSAWEDPRPSLVLSILIGLHLDNQIEWIGTTVNRKDLYPLRVIALWCEIRREAITGHAKMCIEQLFESYMILPMILGGGIQISK